MAAYNEDDVHHKRAIDLARKIDANIYGQAITSDDVFDECLSVALRKLGKEKAQNLGRQIIGSVFIVHCDKHIFDKAFAIFNSSKENFSFTDCAILAVMDMAQIQHIATFDKSFEKFGSDVVN